MKALTLKIYSLIRWSLCFSCIVLFCSNSWADSKNNIIRNEVLKHFNPYPNASKLQNQEIMEDLLNTKSQSNLAFPQFPRTWVELGSSAPVETTTTATFDTSAVASAISTFTGPFSFPARVVLGAAQLSYKSDYSIRYAYNRETTFMAMTSLRPIDEQATQNQNTPIPSSSPELRSVIEQKPDLRNYFKVSKKFPMVGLCKYELSLLVEETKSQELSFIFGSSSEGKKIVARMSYSVYSNFFQIEAHVPIQEYLRTRCGDNFSEAVRFIAEEDFKKITTETFAHYHPQSECRWSPSVNVHPLGDADCMDWFKAQETIGLNKRETVPRCVLGQKGYPVCAIKSKVGVYCPTYASKGQVSDKEPTSWERQLNPMENTGQIGYKPLYQCDVGLQCKLDNGFSISQIPLAETERERRSELQNASFITTCQQPKHHGR